MLGRVFKFVLISVAVLILIGLFLPRLTVCGEKGSDSARLNTIRQIGLASKQYAIDHNDQHPNSLAALTNYYSPPNHHIEIGYTFFPVKAQTNSNSADEILIVEDRPTNGKRCAFYVDGQVAYISEENFQKALKEKIQTSELPSK
jgi:hypothetical protein